MIKSVDKTINGKKFIITQFLARDGLKKQVKLVKLLGPILLSFEGVETGEKDEQGRPIKRLDIKQIAHVLTTSLDENQIFDFVMELIKETRFNGQPIGDVDFDMTFAGDYKTLLELIAFIIEFNFGYFFEEGALTNVFKKQAPEMNFSTLKSA